MRNALFAPMALLALCGAAWAQPAAQSSPDKPNGCFFINQFDNWKAADDRTIYIRVRPRRYFRLDLATTCPELHWPDPHLVTKWRNGDTVCRGIDWDLRVAPTISSPATPCIVRSMTPLSDAEAAALPGKVKP